MKYSPSSYARILYKSKDVDGLIELLKKHWVLPWLPKILEQFGNLLRKKEGIVQVQVISARPLAETVRKDIVRLIKKEYQGKEVEYNFIIEKHLIGGFRVESDELLIPASLKDQIDRLAMSGNLE